MNHHGGEHIEAPPGEAVSGTQSIFRICASIVVSVVDVVQGRNDADWTHDPRRGSLTRDAGKLVGWRRHSYTLRRICIPHDPTRENLLSALPVHHEAATKTAPCGRRCAINRLFSASPTACISSLLIATQLSVRRQRI